MMPWDWIGIVTIRRLTKCKRSTIGMMNRRPGILTPITRPRRKSTPCSYCLTIRIDIPATIKSSSTITTMITANPMVRFIRSLPSLRRVREHGRRGFNVHNTGRPAPTGRDPRTLLLTVASGRCGWYECLITASSLLRCTRSNANTQLLS